MLGRINTAESHRMECVAQEALVTRAESRYNRNEEEDMKTAISHVYELKRKLESLHPNCIHVIDHMLQNNNRVY